MVTTMFSDGCLSIQLKPFKNSLSLFLNDTAVRLGEVGHNKMCSRPNSNYSEMVFFLRYPAIKTLLK